MPIIDYLQDEDVVNGAKDKLNVALGEIITSLVLTDGNLVATRRAGTTITVPLKNVFAQLNTIFNSILPGIATQLEPGLILLGDDENPAHLLSENRVLTAAGVVRLIEAISPGLADVLKQDNIGFGDLILKIDTDANPDQPPSIKLYLKDDANNDLLTSEFTADKDYGTLIKHVGERRIIANANGVQLNGSRAFVEQLLNTATLLIRQMPTAPTATNVLIARSVDGGDSVEKFSITELAKLIGTAINAASDLIVKSLTLTGGDAYDPAKPVSGIYIGQPTDNGIKLAIADPYQLIQYLLPFIISSLNAAGYGGGSGGGTTSRQIRLEGCLPEESAGQPRQTILFDHTALNTAKPHNLKTNAVGIAKAYFVADGQSSGVSVLATIDDYAEFYNVGDVYNVRLKSTAPGYELGKLFLMIERLDSDLTA